MTASSKLEVLIRSMNIVIHFVMCLWVCLLGCENKNLDEYLGLLGKFIEYCRIPALLPVITLCIRNNW